MKRKILLKFFIGVILLILFFKFFVRLIANPLLEKKIQSELNSKYANYSIEIERVHVLVFSSGVELKNININPKKMPAIEGCFKGSIGSIQVNGVNLVKALFKSEIDIKEVSIMDCSFKGEDLLSGNPRKSPVIAGLSIRIGKVHFNQFDLEIRSTTNAKYLSVKKAVMNASDLQIGKFDTLTTGILSQFDFVAEEIVSTATDSMYSYITSGTIYTASTHCLNLKSFTIHPNYADYDFTSRYKFQKDRIYAHLLNIFVFDFNPMDYFSSGSIYSSCVEIQDMDLRVFRDNRKEFMHVKKPSFQELMYDYPGALTIDSVIIERGDIVYTEHAPEGNEPGSLIFNEMHAQIVNITNDTLYNTKAAYLELRADALFMGKSNLEISLKGKLRDRQNTFKLKGKLSAMNAADFNPFIEKNAFLSVTSGKIQEMNFEFTADNTSANGKLILLYEELELQFLSKQTTGSEGIKEKLISAILNRKIQDSNPSKNGKTREGVIYHKRDPERFIFNYCAKSILSGIKSGLIEDPEKRRT